MRRPQTLIEKLWASHIVQSAGNGTDLLHVDRHLLTDLAGTMGLEDVSHEEVGVLSPSLHAAVPDHVISTRLDSREDNPEQHRRFVGGLEKLSELHGIRHFGRSSGMQGIAHLFGLEQAFSLPGLTVVCGDSHTPTHGAIGALAWGIGSTEVKHALATQALWMKKPRTARIWIEGYLRRGVVAKDLILWLIGKLGAQFGVGHAVEFAGPLVGSMSVESRATLCNLAVELGAPYAIIAPDETVFEYLEGRRFSPRGELWALAISDWKELRSDPGAQFDKCVEVDARDVSPQITWGTRPDQTIPISGMVPDIPGETHTRSYMAVREGQTLLGQRVDVVFIGSCANGRIEDLRLAASMVAGKQVAHHVRALIVPGSQQVKKLAEEEGLDQIFRRAGFEWREPGCSMCVAVNGDLAGAEQRVVSTSNRNFIGRQGKGARTHLASPIIAAACALAGEITMPTTDKVPV